MNRIMTCSVCGQKKAEDIFSSSIAPVSCPYCKTCMEKGAEPYKIVVARVAHFRSRGVWSEHLQTIIDSTLEITEHTLDQFEEDVRIAIKKRKKYDDK